MKILFRTDASADIGGGHVVRCLALAEIFRGKGWDCVFAVNDEAPCTVADLGRSGYRMIDPGNAEAEKPDILVVDHYGLEKSYESSCRHWARRIVVVDDLADRPHECDILIDQTYERNPTDYKKLVPSHCRILVGAGYALLRPQFAAAREGALRHRSERRGRVESILISFGAVDERNETETVLNGLQKLSGPLEIVAVLGRGGMNAARVERAVSEINALGRHRASLHVDVSDMALLMVGADLCVGGGGTTSWERCCLGLPAVVIAQADNQKKVIEGLARAGAIKIAPSAAVVPGIVEILRGDPKALIDIAEAAARICDGRGAERVCQAILETVK